MIRNAHTAYENMMSNVEDRDKDPNHTVVISISSDEEGGDEGGDDGGGARAAHDNVNGDNDDIPSNLEDFDFGDDDEDDEYALRPSTHHQPNHAARKTAPSGSIGGGADREERSQYFAPNPEVHAFNEMCTSRSA